MSILLKNPSDNIDFSMTWNNIGTATLSAVVHTVPSALTLVSESNTTTTSTVRVSGATHGKTYQIKAVATLSTGRTLARDFTLRVFEH